MSIKEWGQKFMWAIINALFTLIIGYLILAATSKGDSLIRTQEAIQHKADVEYVDKRDSEIEQKLTTYKTDHNDRHNREYNAMIREFDYLKEQNKQTQELLREAIK